MTFWQKNLILLSSLLFFWFLCSFGFGILLSEYISFIKIGGFELGFWFSQQGSIYVFIILIFTYSYLVERLERKEKK
jgi:putative solute:sodium symporter small subunit